MAKSRTPLSSQLGCGFLLTTGIALIVLLWLNSMFVKTFFASNLTQLDERVFNAAQFMLPIAMLFIEFWLFDAVRDYFRFRNHSND